MKRLSFLFIAAILFAACSSDNSERNDFYITNRAPLIAQPYTALPLGSIKPHGWLLKMLELQRDGLTGHLDSIYKVVCGPDNGWLGGAGDGWERGPYWIDGLLPLAYILDDEDLKAKAQEWVEWSIANQREDGYFGPLPLPDGYETIPGTQQGNREDWWPKMVMLKVLQQYYTATGDERVIDLMSRYFRYQLDNLDEYPLGNWTYWANRRGGDNMAVVYWLYNITGEKFLLDLAELLFEQTFDWTEVYSGDMIRNVNPYAELHCVNIAQGLKQPVIYYQQHPERVYLEAPRKGLDALRDVHGFVNGMYGADENLHGNDPTQGSELCSAVEMMFSFESMLPITGDTYYADYLEKIAFNVLPTQHDDKFLRKQYYQQPNQVMITDETRNFYNDDYGRIVYGVLTGYPCCTTNMHQGWPKFIQNLWYATADNGLAALVYGSSEVTATVNGGKEVRLVEETGYPFRETITIRFDSDEAVSFPLHLRIPGWCKEPFLKINGENYPVQAERNILIVSRLWQKNDKLELVLPMEVAVTEWDETSVGIERGPLVYALRIDEEWKEVKSEQWADTFFEVRPASDWNWGIMQESIREMDFVFREQKEVGEMPWNLEGAPMIMNTRGARVPSWNLVNGSAGKIPARALLFTKDTASIRDITLIPYGCTTLRISEFPVVRVVSRPGT